MVLKDDVGQPSLMQTVANRLVGAAQPTLAAGPLGASPRPNLSQPTGVVTVEPRLRSAVECAIGMPLPESADFTYLRNGKLPVVCSLNEQGEVLEWGDRSPYAAQPTFAAYDFFARAANMSPRTPLQASGDGVTDEPLAIAISEAPAAGPTFQGNERLVPGFIIEVSIDDNIPPGVINCDITGTLEDGSVWSHTGIQLLQRGRGMAQYLVLATKSLQNRTFPCCARLRNDFKVTLGGEPIVVTSTPAGTTAITPTTGVTFTDETAAFEFTQVPSGMHIRVQTLSVTSKYYNVALGVFEALLAIGE